MITGPGGGFGGGLFNDGTLTLTNCTVSGNTASGATITGGSDNTAFGGYGGGLGNFGTLTLTNCTVSGNTASGQGGGLETSSGTATLINTIVAGQSAGGDVDGSLAAASTHNLIGGNPLLAPLGNYGGPTQTMALLPGSPAIGAGSMASIPTGITTDQRGEPRTVNTEVDIGAVETQGYTLTASGGTPQATLASTAFANSLAVTVTPTYAKDPVNGGVITFTPPASGASATLSAGSATIAGGSASVTATANRVGGSYTVMASASGAASATFALTNQLQPAFSGLTASQSIPYDTPATFEGTLAAGSIAATGSVTVTISGNGITPLSKSTTLPSNGTFSTTFIFTPSADPSSAYTVTYTYTAQSYFLDASDSSTTLTVDQATTSVTVTSNQYPSTFGQSVTFSATIAPQYSGNPTGTANLVIDGSTVQSNVTVTNGAVSFTPISTLSVSGSPHSVEVVYNGDSNFTGNNNTLSGGQTVNSSSLSVIGTQVDDGTAQRSMVRYLTLTFSSPITSLSTVMSELSLTRTNGLSITLNGALSNNNTVLKLTFTGTSSTANGSTIIGCSLPDGRYTLSFNGTTVLAPGSAGTDDETHDLWRLFGDLNGQATVTAADETAFLAAMNSRKGMSNYSVYFDYNEDGIIVNADETAFLQRYGTSI